jgi:hypothetical protein
MGARLIQGVLWFDPQASPFERLCQFAGRLVKIPKAEADMEKVTREAVPSQRRFKRSRQ